MMIRKYRIQLCIFAICFISACGPVNLLTKLKKTPRTHSYNYCVNELKAPRSTINKTEWIVYSDRDKNTTTMSPGGKIKFKDLEYLEPLLVIGHHRDYLKLIKYDPKVVKNGALTQRSKVEYYGWIHKSKLLLDNQSITDIRTGLKKKSILSIADTLTINNAGLFFQNDSVKTFKNPNLYNITNLHGLYDIVYIMKRATEKQKVLISKTPYVTPDNIKSSIIGWINEALIQNIGQQLFIDNTSNSPTDSPASQPNSMRYSPIIAKSNKQPISYKTATFLPVIDRSDNCIFNVNGNTISYKNKTIIEQELRQINVLFYVEPGQKTEKQLPALINSFQNMNPIFRDTLNRYSFRFASIIAKYDNAKLRMDTVNFTGSFNNIITHLVHVIKHESLAPVPTELSWKGLNTCMDILEQQNPATNLVIVFGETGRRNYWNEIKLAKRAAKNNCRFLAYQMYSGTGNQFNNFVTQFTDLINATAKLVSTQKREHIVYSSQIRNNNAFVETSKNAFYLDFPERSMTQGGISFPEKNQTVNFTQINTSIDRFILQIKADHNNLIKSIDSAFITIGNSKDKYDHSFLNHFNLTNSHKISSQFKKCFKTTYPLWFKSYTDSISQDSTEQYQLLLSEKELENMRNIIDGIAELNVDTKVIGKTHRIKAKKTCDCPDEFYTSQKQETNHQSDTLKTKYLSTRRSRNSLKTLLINEIYECKYCKSDIKTKNSSLAQISELIFQSPTSTQRLKNIQVKDLTKRRSLSDEAFDELLEYYKKKKSLLDRKINDKISFTSSGETYYWVNCDWVP